MFILKVQKRLKHYLLCKKLKKDYVLIDKKTELDNVEFEGNNKVSFNCYISKSQIGLGSYLGSNSIVKKTKIGRFCSIGPNFKIIDGNHPTKIYVSTYPAFYKKGEFNGFSLNVESCFEEFTYTTSEGRWLCEIGNDVWIGDSVSIINGVSIGDGAIIGTGAVVTKDIPPYAIVAGVPAKIIRYRFNEKQIKKLLDIQWWNWNIDEIKKHAPEFQDVDYFLSKIS